MAHRIQNLANPNKITYLDGKSPKKQPEDFIYLDIQIYELVNHLGTDEAIKYLKNKIKAIKDMEGAGK